MNLDGVGPNAVLMLLFYNPKPPPKLVYRPSALWPMSRGTYIEQMRHDPVLAEEPDLRRDLYREIFIHSSDAIAIISPEGYYIEQNAAHCNLLGYSDEELQGETPAIHMGAEMFGNVSRELAEKGEYRGELVSRTKAGEIRQIELSAFTMRNSSGDPLCYVGIKRDITERKRAEQALRRSETELADFLKMRRSVCTGLLLTAPLFA